ncbi:G-type lectin S-receptor-like serine/threonine-protein kinase At2g19130 [Cryptomeria japonica]|uniref:G-type lectin S-receptor-like serine/threonine-protein kinase At2g19130 n=1 Tax=Cryptomeria japonica TaxID=3369 RepID=UPI0027DA1BB9|nr:G-type lectin S-receptor-like serine/threonine-protein kinase At2g19130 [Cryptomeria japonica]
MALAEKEAVPYSQYPTLSACRAACLENCSCTAFDLTNSTLPICRMWFGDLFNIRVASNSQPVFLRMAASQLGQSISSGGKKQGCVLLISLPVGGVFVLVFAFLVIIFLRWRRGIVGKGGDSEADLPASLRTFTYKELQIATNNFRDKLGKGAFGSVFKGALLDNTLVVVKKLEGSTQVEKQFRAEISTIGNIQHVNLVQLCGFCTEGSERLLVYEYMPNGSPNSFLFAGSQRLLDWKTRFEIALGIARGLVYLHEECRDLIIHSDINPKNILLDSDFSAKVADFGLTKLVKKRFQQGFDKHERNSRLHRS